MTREEAIAIIENEKECVNRANKNDYCNRDCYNCELVKTDTEILTALEMAIQALEKENIYDDREHYITISRALYDKLIVTYDKALSQGPCDDVVSREAVVDDFIEWREEIEYAFGEDYSGVHLLNVAIQKIWDMPSVIPKPTECDDAVSRQAVDDYIVKLLSGYLYEEERERLEKLNAYLWELPPVRPQEQTDTWSIKDVADTFKKHRLIREQEPKILDTIDFAIDASNGDTNYFVGFRNGLRYAKSLVDGEEPQYESCAEQEPKTGHWKSTIDGKPICSECGFVSESEDGYFVSHFCPNCGAKMNEVEDGNK